MSAPVRVRGVGLDEIAQAAKQACILGEPVSRRRIRPRAAGSAQDATLPQSTEGVVDFGHRAVEAQGETARGIAGSGVMSEKQEHVQADAVACGCQQVGKMRGKPAILFSFRLHRLCHLDHPCMQASHPKSAPGEHVRL